MKENEGYMKKPSRRNMRKLQIIFEKVAGLPQEPVNVVLRYLLRIYSFLFDSRTRYARKSLTRQIMHYLRKWNDSERWKNRVLSLSNTQLYVSGKHARTSGRWFMHPEKRFIFVAGRAEYLLGGFRQRSPDYQISLPQNPSEGIFIPVHEGELFHSKWVGPEFRAR